VNGANRSASRSALPGRSGLPSLRILMVPGKRFPTDHPLMETVYAGLLPARGHHVTWVMQSPAVSRSTVTGWNGTVVHLEPGPEGSSARAFWGRRWGWVRLLWRTARVAGRERFDIVQVRNSVTAGCLAVLLRRRTGARFVFQFSFPVLEALVAGSRDRQVPAPAVVAPAARLGIGVRRWLLRRADLVLAVSEEMRRRLIVQGVAPDRVMAFPLGSELPRAPSKRQVERLREELGLSTAPVVLYFGAIDPKRRLDFVVRVAARVRRLQPEARWVLLGPASDGEGDRLRRYAEELGLGEHVLVLGPVPRSEVPRYLGLASVTVSPIPTTALYVASSPTKAVESLALGVPVVGTPIPDQAELIAASQGGAVAPFEEEPFAAAVAGLLADPQAARRMGARGRRHVRSERSYERLAGSVEARYLALVPKGGPGAPPARG